MAPASSDCPGSDVQVLDGAVVPQVRRSRGELRQMVLAAGREVLLSEGLGTGAEHLSFKRVLTHVAATTGVRVTNASVIGRIWENQEEFQLDVVNAVAGIQGDEGVLASSEALAGVLERIDPSTPALRRAWLGELIRVACEGYLEAASTSSAAIQMALVTYVSASQTASADNRLITSFRAVNDDLIARYGELYELGLAACGWRLKASHSMHEVAAVISAVTEGVLLHRLVDPEAFRPVVQPSAVAPGDVEWNTLAVAMNCLVEFYAEPDPDWTG